MKCEWIIQEPDKDEVQQLVQKYDIPELLATIFVNNKLEERTDIGEYLDSGIGSFHDPFLLKDMDKFVNTLMKIKEKNETVAIYGDYDVDGVTSTALVYSVLKELGWKVVHYIPTRLEEGYGLSKTAIMDLFNRNIKNILTVDCGITSFEEVKYANFLQFKIIITDHHEVQGDIPEAAAVVNPKRPDDHYPFKGLAGVGVAFKCMDAILQRMGNPFSVERFLDIVTLGTVADIVPIIGENRLIVKKGIRSLAETDRIGLKRLMKVSGIDIDHLQTHDIGFKIAPKLNAVGRLGSAETALKLLLTEDETEARELSEFLMAQNSKRQAIENQIYNDAISMIESNKDIFDSPVLVLSKRDWHPGVIGIVSSRLTSKYYKPTLMISIDENGVGRGSARSIEQVNIMDLFTDLSYDFQEFGGHPMAAGFTISGDNVDGLREDLAFKFYQNYGSDSFTSKIYIDAELGISDITSEFLEKLDLLRPFGQSNHEPVFLLRNLSVDKLKVMGSRNQHIRMILKQGKSFMDSIGFNLASKLDEFRYIRPNLLKCDIVGNIKTIWHYRTKHVQIFIKDIKFFIDPTFNDEESDKNFIYDLINDWENQSIDHKLQDIKVLREELDHKLMTKYPSFMKILESGPMTTGVFTSLKAQELLVLSKMIRVEEKGEKVLIVLPSNMFLSSRLKSVRRFDSLSTQMIFKPSQEIEKSAVFTTIPFLINNFEKFEAIRNWIFLDLEYMMVEDGREKSLLEKVSEKLTESPDKNTMILGGILSENEKKFMKDIFKFDRFVVEHMKRHKRGLVDRRDHPNPVNYIKSLVQNGNFTAVFVNSPERTVKLTRILGNDLSDYFRNGEVVFYNSTLKAFQRTKIEELISISKVKLFITTYEIGGMIQFPKNSNICLLDPPLTPLNIHAMSNPVEQKGAVPIFHLLYNRNKTKKYINSTFELLPLESDIISLIRIGCSNGFMDVEVLKQAGIENHLLSERNWEIVLAVLSEIGMVQDQLILNKDYNELINRLKTSTVLLESVIDRMIIKDYSAYFINRSGRKVLSLIDYPVLPFIKQHGGVS
ncbi:MAG TPA: single-stranded-DNA-specific exonuclease RecJ [Thermotogota bacterium]|nr:single-stranded-DNA-specific exonuclease RecJ [Thermotogota bacterium]HPJ88408.1 single-stranded-DNA-specific exonuclease RecJ [Thermotogota bacterium]HPR95425.1 single-stranded-DNA-specific exonuclease RecJ [Thermotogota bacterium]